MPYKVITADHFHYMQKDEEYELATFATADEAIAKAKQVVERELAHMHKPGMTCEQLFDVYGMFGKDPYIVTTAGEPCARFSAWDYARQRAQEIGEPPNLFGFLPIQYRPLFE